MNDRLTTVARELVSLPHWRWMPGMLDTAGSRVVSVADGWVTLAGGAEPGVYPLADMGLPDLTDPATLGCVLQLAAESYSADSAYLVPEYDPNHERWMWGVQFFFGSYIDDAPTSDRDTRAEALFHTLKWAPEA